MNCWKCKQTVEDPLPGKLPFRATCDHCHAWLHCCVNCQNYAPGLPNDCAVPGTETIADREGCNFCEEFALKTESHIPRADPGEVSKRLFGEDIQPPKTTFNDLFHD
jgi:hypothetical protein